MQCRTHVGLGPGANHGGIEHLQHAQDRTGRASADPDALVRVIERRSLDDAGLLEPQTARPAAGLTGQVTSRRCRISAEMPPKTIR